MLFGDLIVDPQTGDTLDTTTMMNVTTGSVPSTAQGQLIAAYNEGQSALPTQAPSSFMSSFNSFLNSLAGAANTVLSFNQQQQLNQINVQRAQAGLPALSTQAYLTGQGAGTTSPIAGSTLLLVGLGAVAVIALARR